MFFLFAILTGLYAAVAAATVVVLLLKRPAAVSPPTEAPFVSVIVPARNEEENLPACLAALQRQDYPAGRIEFVIADDGSTDATPALLDRIARADARFRPVAVPQAAGLLRGKARALHTAIQAARGAYLLLTDADCTPPPCWAHHLADRLDEPGTGVVCGVTLVQHETLLDRIQALDWLLVSAVAAAASAAGVPITAMGNNMAIRRSTYDDVGGYPALPFSVTEDYALFQAVHRSGRWRVRLLLDEALANHTRPLPSPAAIFEQRKRWARGGLRASAGVLALYAVILGCHAALVLGLVLRPAAALPFLVLKLIADLAVLLVAMRRTAPRGLLRSFLPFEGFFTAYLLLLPLSMALRPRTEWKGRTY
jgi:1,2-diacylglycerol 3-beta-glucosyltransferase